MTQAVNCPGCSKQITIDDSPQVQENISLHQQIEQLQKEPKMQAFVPSYQCKDGTCGQNHTNPRYTKRPKGKCHNCDQISANKEGKCTWYKQKEIEEIDKDELENLSIELPN